MKARIELKAKMFNGSAGIMISADSREMIAPNVLNEDPYFIDVEFTPGQQIIFKMIGKNHAEDTLVDSNGLVVEDKAIEIVSIQIQYVLLDNIKMHAIGFEPYLGINGKKHILQIPQLDTWSDWYLTIEEKVNGS